MRTKHLLELLNVQVLAESKNSRRLFLLSARTIIAIDVATIDRDNSPKLGPFVYTPTTATSAAEAAAANGGQPSVIE